MAGHIISFNRLAILSLAFVILCIVLLSSFRIRDTKVVEKIKESAKDTANHICNHDRPVFGKPTISDSINRLFETIQYPIDAPSYTNAYGKVFDAKEDAPWWTEPLRDDVLILDIDTRVPNGENELWHEGRMNWEAMNTEGDGSMMSASFMNHFLYAKIHGYDYRFFNAHEMEGMHNTWVKPHILYDLLHKYRFVIFIDADATIQHLEVPVEWLFNRWGITPSTSIAMPLDTRQLLNGDSHASEDSKRHLQLNTGFIVSQSLPHTFALLTAWKDCPTGKTYPTCTEWKENWSHEQKAFSEYIRYDYNPNGTNIVEIPCNDAMGYPGLKENNGHIQSRCEGVFVRHHTIDKARTRGSVEGSLVQSVVDVVRKELWENRGVYWIKEG